ncbi:MarR family winged helix-turn-helix transcriptional regulator [Streptomyces solisilvae]|uniref:MarR family winged helix-turn-helix transcriptional regulator n=1 Tax=Streptomyces malaysiensis TaxID=92644 RepID=UPI0036834CB9
MTTELDVSGDLAHIFRRVERRLADRLRSALEPTGCTVEQWWVLSLLSDGAGRTMSEVADYLLLPAPTVTKLVDRLVDNNIVYRQIDLADRRRVRIRLTSRGRSLHRRLAELVERSDAALAAATGEGELLTGLLTRLSQTLGEQSQPK